MPLPGHYVINFTDPENGSFIIEPYKTDGNTGPTSNTLHQNSNAANTSMLLFGRGMPDYGENFNENLVHLLESFAGPVPPTNPHNGQLWFQTGRSSAIVSFNVTAQTLTLSEDISSLVTPPVDVKLFVRYLSDQTAEIVDPLTIDSITTNTLTINPGTPFPNYVTGSSYVYWDVQPKLKIYNGTEWVTVNTIFMQADSPEEPINGELWLDPIDPALGNNPQVKYWNGTSWISVANNYLPLAGGLMAGVLDMGTHEITNVVDPSNPQDAATKQYVDDEITTLSGSLGSDISGKLDIDNTAGAGTGTLDWNGSGVLQLQDSNLDMSSGKILNLDNTGTLDSSQEAISALYFNDRVGPIGTGADTYVNVNAGTSRYGMTVNEFFVHEIGSGAITHLYSNPGEDIHYRLSVVEAATGSTTAPFLNLDGSDTMLGNVNFDIPLAIGESYGLYFTDGVDTHRVFSEALDAGGAGGASALVLEIASITGSETNDVIIFRSTVDGTPSDVMTIGRDVITLGTNIQIKNLLDPTDPQDAATKSYVDSSASSTPDSTLVSHIIQPVPNNGSLVDVMSPTGTYPSGTYPVSTVDETIRALDYDKLRSANPIIDQQATMTYTFAVVDVNQGSQLFAFAGDYENQFIVDAEFIIQNSTGNNGTYTVASVTYNSGLDQSEVTVNESIPDATIDGEIVFASVAVVPEDVATKQYVDGKTKNYRDVQTITGVTTYTVPEYRVGTFSLWVFVDGLKSLEGVDYDENIVTLPATAGYADILFSGVVGTDTAGLLVVDNPHTCTITIDGTPYPVSINETVDDTLTYNDIAGQVQTAIGANGTVSFVGDTMTITSATTGSSSTVAVVDSNLFVLMTNYSSISEYAGTDPTPSEFSTSIDFIAPVPTTGTVEFIVMGGTL